MKGLEDLELGFLVRNLWGNVRFLEGEVDGRI